MKLHIALAVPLIMTGLISCVSYSDNVISEEYYNDEKEFNQKHVKTNEREVRLLCEKEVYSEGIMVNGDIYYSRNDIENYSDFPDIPYELIKAEESVDACIQEYHFN